MNPRILVAIAFGLIVVALGGFYVALAPHASDAVRPARQIAAVAPLSVPPAASQMQPAQPSVGPSATPVAPGAPGQSTPPLPTPTATPGAATPAPPPATADTVENEIALSEYADLMALLKKNFPAEYGEVIAALVQKRNDGASDDAFGQDLAERTQALMRTKLKFGAGATMPTIDRLAANEASLFHALGTEGAPFCLKMLGKDDSPAVGAPPDSVRQKMNLGTLYRFQAIVEGLANGKPVEPLKPDEMRAFEAALGREGLNYRDISTGAYMNAPANPGQPCLTLETMHLAIARLPEATRRKIYAGMFFAGRDK